MTNPYEHCDNDECQRRNAVALHICECSCIDCCKSEGFVEGIAAGAAEVAALRAALDVAFRALEAAKEETDGTEAHAIVMSALSLKKPAATTTEDGKDDE